MHRLFKLIFMGLVLVATACSNSSSDGNGSPNPNPEVKPQKDLTEEPTSFRVTRVIQANEVTDYLASQRSFGCKTPGEWGIVYALDPAIQVGSTSTTSMTQTDQLNQMHFSSTLKVTGIGSSRLFLTSNSMDSFSLSGYGGPTVLTNPFQQLTWKVNTETVNGVTSDKGTIREPTPGWQNNIAPEFFQKMSQVSVETESLCKVETSYLAPDISREVSEGYYVLSTGQSIRAYRGINVYPGEMKCPDTSNPLHGKAAKSKMIWIQSNQGIPLDFSFCGGMDLEIISTNLVRLSDKSDAPFVVYGSSRILTSPAAIRN